MPLKRQPSQTPIWFIPPKGDHRPGGRVPVRWTVPRIRALNIISSELCNSRRHRQRPASRVSEKHTPGARSTVLQGVRLHNSDYVKCLRHQGARGLPSNLPGDAPPGCNEPPSGASGLQARWGAQHFARLRSHRIKKAAPRRQSSQDADALETTGAAHFFVSEEGSMQGRKVQRVSSSSSRHRHLSRGGPVLCVEPGGACSEAAGRPGTVHRQSSGAGQPMSGTVPPR